jgi:hypothetical protein
LQLLGQLIATRVAEELVLGLVRRLRLGNDLAGDPLVVEVRLAACVRGELRTVDRHHPGADQPRPRAQPKHRAEQPRERSLVADQETRDRRVVGDPVGADHPVGDVLAAVALDRARGALPGRIGVEQQRDHHRRLISGATMAIGAVIGVELVQNHLRHRIDHEPREVILRQPLAQRRRHQKDLLTITSDEVLSHDGIVFAGPDGRGVCATASVPSARPSKGV